MDYQLHRSMGGSPLPAFHNSCTGKPDAGRSSRIAHTCLAFPALLQPRSTLEAADGRPAFVLPWNEQVLVGTTEVPDNGDPAKTSSSQEEIDYLFRTVSQLFPKAKFSAHDIKYAFAGVRPLPNAPGDKPSAVTRGTFCTTTPKTEHRA